MRSSIIALLFCQHIAATSPQLASRWRTMISHRQPSFFTNSILSETIDDQHGSCQLQLTRQPHSTHAILHICLAGRGTRLLAKRTLRSLSRGMRNCDAIVCVVDMSQSKGSSLMALPPIARFMVANGGKLQEIHILEARGLALSAVLTVQRLSRLGGRIRCFKSREEFDIFLDKSSATHHMQVQRGLRAAQGAVKRRPWSW